MFVGTRRQLDVLHRLEHPVSTTAGTIRSIFCPMHRRRADFKLRDSGEPTNPDMICPVDGFRLSYGEIA